MRVCLLNPKNNTDKHVDTPSGAEALGISYIAAYLENFGIAVDLIDFNFNTGTVKEIIKTITNPKYLAVGISAFFYNFKSVMKCVKYLSSKNDTPFLFIGGYLPTLSPDHISFMLNVVDCFVVGEGEITTKELIFALSNNHDWRNIDGIIYKDEEKIVKTNKRELISNLDTIPFPKRYYFSKDKMGIITTRGCYGKCNFCSIPYFYDKCKGVRFRRRSPENVINEIEGLITEYNIDTINIKDDNFSFNGAVNKKWFESFISLLELRNIDIKFKCFLRTNEIIANLSSFEVFVEYGLVNIFVGIESFLQKHLNFYQKRINAEDNIKVMSLLKEYNIDVSIGYLLFNPITTIEDVLISMDIMSQLEYSVNIRLFLKPIYTNSTVIATRNTPLYNYVIKKGIFANNERQYVFEDKRIETAYLVCGILSKNLNLIYSKVNKLLENRNIYNNTNINLIGEQLFKTDIIITKFIFNHYYLKKNELQKKTEEKFLEILKSIGVKADKLIADISTQF